MTLPAGKAVRPGRPAAALDEYVGVPERASDPKLSDLLKRFDPDPSRAVERFNALRNRLSAYFDRRGIVSEELVEKTFETLIQKLQDGGVIADVERLAVSIAVVLGRGHAPPRPLGEDVPAPPDLSAEEDERLPCVRRCMDRLDRWERDLIRRYFDVERGNEKAERRRALADRLGLSVNALRIRVHKIRAVVEACAVRCVRMRRGERA